MQDYISAFIAAVAIIVALTNSLTSTRTSAFNDLKSVVEVLKTTISENKLSIAQLQSDLSTERKLRMQYEDYIHALIGQMKDNKIIPLEMGIFVTKEK